MEAKSPSSRLWEPVAYEEIPWHFDPDALEMVPKSRRRKITATYWSAIPVQLDGRALELPASLIKRMEEVAFLLVRFDARQEARGYDLPALLLRSESAASSQIENLTSSIRNVALAELSPDAPKNAQLIAGNVAAMRKALQTPDDISVQVIKDIHSALIGRDGANGGESFGGQIRDEAVWVGGTAYSPHGALFVPPCASRVPACLDDLIAFIRHSEMPAIAKAAIGHAQFETIHPFIDGNGRTGRTLLHVMLRSDEVLRHASLPISAGLLHNIDAYMNAISEYQAGNPIPIVEQLVDALELSLVIGSSVANDIDEVFVGWQEQLGGRKDSALRKLPNVLARQPVVDSSFVAQELGVSVRSATSVINKACELGMLRPMGNKHRGVFYQCDELIDVLEDISSMEGIRRLLRGR